VLPIDRDVRDAILTRFSGTQIEAIARRCGVASLRDDGLAKVWQGLTTVEEVFRVTTALQTDVT
jgi:type II secretory ATPase GspE/PulE/Tfp pilus assembly ATPase PilB-like protein